MEIELFSFPFEVIVILILMIALVLSPLMTIYVERNRKKIHQLSYETSIVQFAFAIVLFSGVVIQALIKVISDDTKYLNSLLYKILLGIIVAGTSGWSYLVIRHMRVLMNVYFSELNDFNAKPSIVPCKEMLADATARGINPCWGTVIVPPIAYIIGVFNLIEPVQEYFMVIFGLSLSGVALGTTIRMITNKYFVRLYTDAIELNSVNNITDAV